MNYDDLFSLTVVMDRYTGTYSGGKYTAWNLEYYQIPSEISDDDETCAEFWLINNEYIVGIGETPMDAINDLVKKLNR